MRPHAGTQSGPGDFRRSALQMKNRSKLVLKHIKVSQLPEQQRYRSGASSVMLDTADQSQSQNYPTGWNQAQLQSTPLDQLQTSKEKTITESSDAGYAMNTGYLSRINTPNPLPTSTLTQMSRNQILHNQNSRNAGSFDGIKYQGRYERIRTHCLAT